jgi:hypothetical protein
MGVGTGRDFTKIKTDAAYDHIHGGELPCGVVGFLPVYRDVINFTFVGGNKLFLLQKKAASAHGGVVDTAFKGFEHLHN